MSKRLVTARTLRSAQDGIAKAYTINCVSPGPIETPLYPQFESLMVRPILLPERPINSNNQY